MPDEAVSRQEDEIASPGKERRARNDTLFESWFLEKAPIGVWPVFMSYLFTNAL